MKKLYILFLFAFAISINFVNAQWQPVVNLNNGWIGSIATRDTNIFVADNGGGIFLSTNNGNTWSAINNGLQDSIVHALLVSGENIFLGIHYGGVYSSNNNGSSWSLDTSGLIYNPYFGDVYIDGYDVVTLAMGSGNLFEGSTQGLFLSSDSGLNWTWLVLPDDTTHGNYTMTGVESIAATGSMVYAAKSDGFIYVSNNSGLSWTQVIDTALPDEPYYNALVINGTEVFAGTQDYGIYLSTDSGRHWISINNGIPSSVGSIAISGSNIFIATWSGVFVSTNNGSSWASINSGLTDSIVNAIAVNGTDVFAGTSDGTVWRRALSDILPCSANFTLYADTLQLHHYIATNYSFGKLPIKYDWSWGDGTSDTIPYPSHTYVNSGFYTICLTITDSTGCISTYCDSSFHALRTANTMVYVNVVHPLYTAIQEANSPISNFNIYPNPATHRLTLQIPYLHANEAVMVEVRNVLGQETSPPVRLQTRGGSATIDVSGLSSGVYFVEVNGEKERWVGKFVKE